VISRITLENFMSHKETLIEPSPGLTVLVGPNNCGKSAVVVALQILATNENSTYVMRHGAKETRVTVETDDDHTVEWARKTSGGPSYVVDGERFDRLRHSVPEAVHGALRIGPVVSGSEGGMEFDLHFGSQKSPVFLLDESGAAIAQFFASSSDAEKLVKMQQLHREKVRRARAELERLQSEEENIDRDLAALASAGEIAALAGDAENKHEVITALRMRIGALSDVVRSIARERSVVAHAAARSRALEQLERPPALHTTKELATLISDIRKTTASCTAATARVRALDSLSSPPDLRETHALRETISALRGAQQKLDQAEAVRVRAEHAVDAAREEIAGWVQEEGRCPYCGGELSVEQVLHAGGEHE
jgi:exonuclease SbcC